MDYLLIPFGNLLKMLGLSTAESNMLGQIGINAVLITFVGLVLFPLSYFVSGATFRTLTFSEKVYFVSGVLEMVTACAATAVGGYVALGIPWVADSKVWAWTEKVEAGAYITSGMCVVQLGLRIWFRNTVMRDGTSFVSSSALFAEATFGLIALPVALVFRSGCWFVAVGLLMHGCTPLFTLRRLMSLSGMRPTVPYCVVGRLALIPAFVIFRVVPVIALLVGLGLSFNDVWATNNSVLLGLFAIGGVTAVGANAWWLFVLLRAAVRHARLGTGCARRSAQQQRIVARARSEALGAGGGARQQQQQQQQQPVLVVPATPIVTLRGSPVRRQRGGGHTRLVD